MNFNLLSHLTCPQFICVLDKKLSIQDQHAWLTPQLLFPFVLFFVNDFDLKFWNFPPVNRECRGAVKRVTGILKNSFCFLCVACLVAVAKCRMKRTQGRKVCSGSHLESVVGPPRCDRQGSRSWGRCSHCTCKPRARFLLSIQFRTPAQGWCFPQLGRIFPPQINLLETVMVMPRGLSPRWL